MTTRTDDVLERLGAVENRLTAVEVGIQNLREGQQQQRADFLEGQKQLRADFLEGQQQLRADLRETNSRIEGTQNRIEGLQRDFNARFDGIQTDFNARMDRMNARLFQLFLAVIGVGGTIVVALLGLIATLILQGGSGGG